ncbi:MAG: J domain-containing protein [Planctomyces sp.]|nr:J domain-containing protein [Planctomyces sp.]
MLLEHLQTLGLSLNATGEEIRNRYLDLVKQFPPEQFPQRATQIRCAYDFLRDPVHAWKEELFSTKPATSIEAIALELIPDIRSSRIPTDVLLSLARS